MLLLIDNYDSFTYNLARYFQELDHSVMVKRNDQISLADIAQMQPTHIVISPGPRTPQDAGMSLAIIEKFAGEIPLLGVCLGHQCIAHVFGGNIVRAQKIMHGKTSLIQHQQQHLFASLPNPLRATRYHSLVIEPTSLPATLEVIAWSETNEDTPAEIMAIAHRQLPLYGVQFHPESILTEHGHQILRNFLHQN